VGPGVTLLSGNEFDRCRAACHTFSDFLQSFGVAAVPSNAFPTADEASSLAPRTKLIVGLVPALLAAAVFANTLDNKFAYDDGLVVARASDWQVKWHQFARSPWRSLTYATHVLDFLLWGKWPPGFHLTNLILHAIASSLAASVGFILTRSVRTGILCGTLFAVHPVHVEAVASIANRKDILAMIFVLLSLVVWLPARRTRRHYFATFFFVALAYLAKEIVAAGAVPMLFLADLLFRSERAHSPLQRFTRTVWHGLPFILLTLAATVRLIQSVPEIFENASIDRATEGLVRNYAALLATSAGAIPEHFRLLFFPVTLSADYPVRVHHHFAEPGVRLGIGLLLLWLLVAVAAARRAPLVTFAMLWVIVTYLPCANIVPLTHFLVAERYLYAPSFGICLLAAAMLDQALGLADRNGLTCLKRAVMIVCIAVIAAAGGRSFLRNRDWHDGATLASAALAAGFDTWRMHSMLGMAIIGEAVKEDRDYASAAAHFERAVELRPFDPVRRYELATALVMMGRIEQARRQLRDAVERRDQGSQAPPALVMLGLAFASQGETDEAVRSYRRALELRPNQPAAHHNLGVALAAEGNLDDAIQHYAHALRLKPGQAQVHYSMGVAFSSKGDVDEAIRHYRRAVEINPDHVQACNNLAWLLAVDQGSKLGQSLEAIRLAEHASELSRYRDPSILDTLAAAYAAAGRFTSAVEFGRRALLLASEAQDAQLASDIRGRLQFYQRELPANSRPH
jgi:tetratricopeptide (TPR) repeat protein